MDLMKCNDCSFKELSLEEAKFVNGGEPGKTTSFYYDAFYEVTHSIGDAVRGIIASEILTFQFWEDWGYSVL